ncbi:hypothetical protein, partial [Escherichia coli]|uniref:hypothetical protein n=1 Tax=Escherichia coli TaxID=562 RepID=UPI0032E43B1A
MACTTAVFMVSGLTNCGYPWRDEPPCFPPDYVVNPSTAKVGDTVTVSARDADCNPRYGHDARIQVTLTDASGQNVIKDTGPMNDAGGFTYVSRFQRRQSRDQPRWKLFRMRWTGAMTPAGTTALQAQG